jgi:hypothetical protein
VDIGAGTKYQWQNKRQISPAILRNAFRKVRSQTIHHAIRPITEFHYLDADHHKNVDSLRKRLKNEKIFNKLNEQEGGVYAFFDTKGEVIYVGRTFGNLFKEIEQSYNNKHIRFRIIGADGKAKWKRRPIKEIAQFVSAYGVHEGLITNVEALLTRIIINKASNIRTEHFTADAKK